VAPGDPPGPSSDRTRGPGQVISYPSIYPPNLPTLPFLAQWLQKALAAREAAINYSKEVKNEIIEVIV
jgi:hypothetical protein